MGIALVLPINYAEIVLRDAYSVQTFKVVYSVQISKY